VVRSIHLKQFRVFILNRNYYIIYVENLFHFKIKLVFIFVEHKHLYYVLIYILHVYISLNITRNYDLNGYK
jgi:hypothetical protein